MATEATKTTKEPTLYKKNRDQLETGDIILMADNTLASLCLRYGTGCHWSHVGMVIKLGEDSVMLWESMPWSDLKDRDTGEYTMGVMLVPLSLRISRYRGRVAYRKLDPGQQNRDDFGPKLEKLRGELAGRPYERDLFALIGAEFDHFVPQNKVDLSSLFCSELVAEAYQRLELLLIEDQGGLPADEYTPENFSSFGPRVLNLQKGAQLGEEILLKEWVLAGDIAQKK